MQFDLEKAVEIIKSNPTFLKTKDVIENSPNHHGETTYEHCVQTFELATKLISGDLITNQQAKIKFEEFLTEEVGGIKKRDLLQIAALVHDCGKIVNLDGRPYTSIPKKPGHGYWGSLLVPDILLETGLPTQAVEYVANCVRLHLAGEEHWATDSSLGDLLLNLKLTTEGFHREVIFNIYCDLFYSKGFQDKIHLPIELLNLPETYEKLKFDH